MAGVDYLLALQHGDTFRKVTKIVLYKNAIGFAVFLPFHKSRRGHLFKSPANYKQRERTIEHSAIVEQHVVSDTVKLSFHFDGFVQFSSAGRTPIISGIDTVTGMAKGLGLKARPLMTPCRSGPTFGGSVWGLDDYVRLSPKELEAARSLVWTERDYYYRRCTSRTWNSYVFEGFLFPKSLWPNVRLEKSGGRLELRCRLRMRNYEIPDAVFDFKVVPTSDNPFYFMGLIVSRIRGDFESPSGYTLGGLTGRGLDNDGKPAMLGLHAAYPALESGMGGSLSSLDYVAPR